MACEILRGSGWNGLTDRGIRLRFWLIPDGQGAFWPFARLEGCVCRRWSEQRMQFIDGWLREGWFGHG